LRGWHDKYQKDGLTIIGVHTPEFFWEKSLDKVTDAVSRLSIRFPVVQDNDYVMWKRFGVWAWPTIIVADRKGIVRYRHIGEGAYDKTESVIKQLLVEKH
jgi:hypothetical protein